MKWFLMGLYDGKFAPQYWGPSMVHGPFDTRSAAEAFALTAPGHKCWLLVQGDVIGLPVPVSAPIVSYEEQATDEVEKLLAEPV